MNNLKPFGSKHLFNYVKLSQPKIIDMAVRARKFNSLGEVMKKSPADQEKWAKEFIASGKALKSESELKYDYFSYLDIEKKLPEKLPSRHNIKDLKTFPGKATAENKDYRTDLEKTLLSLAAFKILKDHLNADTAGRMLHFIESFPSLPAVDQRLPYLPAVFSKKAHVEKNRASAKEVTKRLSAAEKGKKKMDTELKTAEELHLLSENLVVLWKARSEWIQDSRNTFEKTKREILDRKISITVPAKDSSKQVKEIMAKANAQQTVFMRAKKDAVIAAKAAYERINMDTRLANILDAAPKDLVNYARGRSVKEINNIQLTIKTLLDKYKLPLGKFCDTYEKVILKKDLAIKHPQLYAEENSFMENPVMNFQDTVRVLGRSDLIKVEERFIKYTPGEVSYIENILAGELRKRKVNNTSYFEQVSESMTEEVNDTSKETSSSSKQELSNEVEAELSTRLNSDISSSVSASGGGTLGVVDMEGAGSVDLSMDVGLDTSLNTTDKSDFSQEIVNKALEKVKKTTLERRMSRSYSLFQTSNYHEVNNTGAGNTSRNGIYCFLDKHICITETVYGKRLFLMSNILFPGRNLLSEKKTKLAMSLGELGEKPVFDISPADINPGNYKELTGRFKASGIKPPPSPVLNIGKTYKTESANANTEQKEFKMKNVADILVPFFEQYKRYLVTDNIPIPEGYEVKEVLVTVNHGSNGISVPAHLPLKLAGAAMFSSPYFAAGAIFHPYLLYGIWATTYMASPLLHYNTDSSNVTVCVGNESYDSPYYFFEPDFLMRELFQMMGNFSAVGPSLMTGIKKLAETLITDLKDKAGEIPGGVMGAIDSVLSGLKEILDSLAQSNLAEATTKITTFKNSIINIDSLKTTASHLFDPLEGFIKDVLDLFTAGLQDAFSDLFSFLTTLFDNSQTLPFYSVSGTRDELPVSFNTVAIKPGITINLNVCVIRTEEGLDKWRLETFNSFYQSHLQLLAEYESRSFLTDKADRIAKSPGTMRKEEHLAVKELVLYTLNNIEPGAGNKYRLEKMNLFENAIDWKNMSYKVYNYGPDTDQVMLEKLGAYMGVDDRRKSFLKALWAQVLIPLQPVEGLEKQIGAYIETGNTDFDFEKAFENNEVLTAVYRDLILERELLNEDPEVTYRDTVIPTDLVLIQDLLPENEDSHQG